MGSLAVRIQDLGKQYRLGVGAATGELLTERIGSAVRRRFRRWRRHAAPESGRDVPFWALAGVTFDVMRGDTVGIVGRNGAGKSTLLKILARITTPSAGRVELYGRAGALLEVGTGFHPELTGRENVFLNGAILGMRRAEISRKFDEIVAFAELEKFIDTPVKRYSSGMGVRLAFAVAAHLEPEILIVDEVLAVGDAAFQRRCLGKMGEVAREGRTVIFVSHDLTAVQVLCRKAVYLHDGRLRDIGPVGQVVARYVSEAAGQRRSALDRRIPLGGGVSLVDFGFSEGTIESGGSAHFEIEVAAEEDTRLDELAVILNDGMARRVGVIDMRQGTHQLRCTAARPLRLRASLASLPLVEGEYRVGLFIKGNHLEQLRHDLVTIEVTPRSTHEFVPVRAELRGVVDLAYTVVADETTPARFERPGRPPR
jgi:lipopolysaccharide transport system ATP-binding protein